MSFRERKFSICKQLKGSHMTRDFTVDEELVEIRKEQCIDPENGKFGFP